MQETVRQISNQVTEKWNGLSKKHKIEIGIAVGLLMIIIVVAAYLTRPQMRVLYNDKMDTKFVAQTTQVLSENNITYKVINDGTNIEVNEDQYNAAVLALSLNGVTDTDYSFADMINTTMSTTENEWNERVKHLTKEDLQATLKQIKGVKDATVQLNIPEEKNSFIQSKQESSASIFLTLSEPLSSKQAEGIASFMAYAVKNLDKKNVIILDSTGNTIYQGGEEASLALSQQQEVKKAAEAVVKEKVTDLLGDIYNDVRISPNLVLNFDHYVENNKEYTAQGDDGQRGVITQENTMSSSSNSTDESGGEPGTATNGGDVTNYVQDDNSGTSSSKDNQKEITYAPNVKETQYQKNMGDIDLEKSSIAVNVIRNKIYREEEITPTLVGTTWAEFKAQNGNQQAFTIEQGVVDAIKAATGIQTVSVNGYEIPKFIDQEAYAISIKDYLMYIVLALIFIVGALAIVMRFRKHDNEVEVEPELEVEEMLKTAKEEVELEEIELKETLETKRQIDKFVDEKPEAVANLLRNWITEEDWE
ncbi:flagellar M-ring protein FliF C-terminal domain-containing protein [Cellulosilyticum ruminicola]|uniref:flagellar M-ring protein FliF C-terminal domain-containing protein n=1 Tax=Cellulosilyticum ruminicola TaxID=425254 RepID=UPI0006D0B5C6|nr:flagellar M-ring protein FliF C-terminal domain-containing protein [Cellulosilyticum ruminicola]